jgi:hypothetical protein
LSLSDNRYASITSSGGVSTTLNFNVSNGTAPSSALTINPDKSTVFTGPMSISFGGGTASATQALNISNGGNLVAVVAKAQVGNYNGIVQANDSLLYYTTGSAGTGSFVIAPWSGASDGVRIDSNGTINAYASGGNQMILKAGTASNPSIIFRNDGSTFYILKTAASVNASGSWDTTRPFAISFSDGSTAFGTPMNINAAANFNSSCIGWSDGSQPGGDFRTPNNGTTGGLRLRGNATSATAYLQVTDSAASSEWAYIKWTNSIAQFSGQIKSITNGFYASADWYRMVGTGGLYWETYGRGIQPADPVASYGNLAVYGGGNNGWQGIAIGTSNKTTWMTDSSSLFGMYDNTGGGWLIQSDFSGNFTAKGNVTAYSDLRLKENVRPIPDVTARRDNLAASAIMYERDGRSRIGYGAQLLRDNGNPEFVHEKDDAMKLATGLGTLSVDYGETAAILAVASKNTDDNVAALVSRVALLEETINRLEAMLRSKGIE